MGVRDTLKENIDYSVYRRDRENDRRGGGVLIAIKDRRTSSGF